MTVATAKQSKAIDGLGHFVLWLITLGGVDVDGRSLVPRVVVLFAQSLVAGLEAQASARGAQQRFSTARSFTLVALGSRVSTTTCSLSVQHHSNQARTLHLLFTGRFGE
ncbi:hypothetical protein GN958_ATG23641 [Phytophthora infestans]|uniref:Uncharacterized protein n=1 Tax=Phytophthora infestans TaxID=4787 RepID=A0A8S9TIL5_PHYIN|nr:hypothetical protein GN958_ATG23641 [Phytophthora infestans]